MSTPLTDEPIGELLLSDERLSELAEFFTEGDIEAALRELIWRRRLEHEKAIAASEVTL